MRGVIRAARQVRSVGRLGLLAVACAAMMMLAPTAAAAAEGETCTTDVAADLVPTGIDPDVGDWVVGRVDVWTESVDACEGVTVAASLKDDAGETLASGRQVFADGAASVEMDDGLAPVRRVVEVVIELPVDGEDPVPVPEVPDDDGSDVLAGSEEQPTSLAAPPSRGEAKVLAAREQLPRTGATTVMYLLLGLGAVALGLWMLRFRDLMR